MLADGFADVVPFYDIAESFRHVHPLSNGWFAAPLTAQDRDNTAAVLAAMGRRRIAGTSPAVPRLAAAARGMDVRRRAGRQRQSLLHSRDLSRAARGRGVRRRRCPSWRRERSLRADRRGVPANRRHRAGPRQPRAARRRTSIAGWARAARAAVHDCALSDDEGEALFHDGLDYASQLSSTGRMRVMRRRLDALDLAPTFIKLHLEGAELPALKGARATLLKHRPIVAATVYHNDDGIWRTRAVAHARRCRTTASCSAPIRGAAPAR